MQFDIVYHQKYKEGHPQRTSRADVDIGIKVLILIQCQNRTCVAEEFYEG